MLPAAEDFIREVRDIYSRVDTPEERFKEIQPHLEKLLQDEELREVSKTWPFRNCRVALNCEMRNPTKSTALLCP